MPPTLRGHLYSHLLFPQRPSSPRPLLQLPFFHLTIHHRQKSTLPPRPTLTSTDLKHTYLKGSGPGGQKINKTNSAVQMTHLPTGIVVKSQATRSRSQNFTIAKRILAEKVELLEKGEESRTAQKWERDRKKKDSAAKKRRRKYRRIEEGKEGRGDGEGEDGDGEENGGQREEGVRVALKDVGRELERGGVDGSGAQVRAGDDVGKFG